MKYHYIIFLSGILISQYEINSSHAVGKTHFVVGMPQEEYQRYEKNKSSSSAEHVPVSSHQACKILFSPDDDIHEELLHLIDHERDSIKMAMYLFTDKDIASALQKAKSRGVVVECITDATCLSNKFNRIDELASKDIPVWIYRPVDKKSIANNAMHHKFIVFGSHKVLTGSLNITHSAQRRNQENVVVLYDPDSIKKFGGQFEKLKTRCSRLVPQHKS